MISVVIPVLNEKENLSQLYARVSAAAEDWIDDYEVLVVDDGSDEETAGMLRELHERDDAWRVLHFSRNFGHQAAISAGIWYSRGDCVVVMDGDLQDPPELIEELLAKWREGYQVVYAVRRTRQENILKQCAYKLFYRLFRRLAAMDIPLDAGDFCVMDRVVVDVLKNTPERTRFVRGLRSWAGFRQTGVEYERPARLSGKPKFTLRKLFRLAFDGLVSFSDHPLRLAGWIGMGLCSGAVLLAGFLAIWWCSGLEVGGIRPGAAAGWTSIVCLLLLLFGIQMLMIGVIGEYLARVYTEVKQRPPWVIREALGFETRAHTRSPGWFVFPESVPATMAGVEHGLPLGQSMSSRLEEETAVGLG